MQRSNLILSTALQVQYLLQSGETQGTKLTKIRIIRIVGGGGGQGW